MDPVLDTHSWPRKLRPETNDARHQDPSSNVEGGLDVASKPRVLDRQNIKQGLGFAVHERVVGLNALAGIEVGLCDILVFVFVDLLSGELRGDPTRNGSM